MQPHHTGYCKVTVSLPCARVEYADQEAARTSQSRSEIISRALALAKKAHRDELAARGYAFYAQEGETFAASAEQLASDWLAAENWGNER